MFSATKYLLMLPVHLLAALRTKLQHVIAVRDLAAHSDLQHSQEYGGFLTAFFPIFKDLLHTVQPVFQRGIDEQQLRHTVLEILCRLPAADPLKRFAPDLLDLSLMVLQSDNEDNALLCLRTISELFKAFRSNSHLEQYSRPFLDFSKEVGVGYTAGWISLCMTEACYDQSSCRQAQHLCAMLPCHVDLFLIMADSWPAIGNRVQSCHQDIRSNIQPERRVFGKVQPGST